LPHPPGETLLTINDQGDLWIKGQLYDYAFQTEITLDPNTDYWTLRDATGKIVWALEVHNPGTGVSTGDLYSIGSFEGWVAEPDQTGALLRYTNASARVVFSLSAAGEARSRRTAPQRDSAPPYPTVPQPPAIVPDTPPAFLTLPLPEGEYASLENLYVPKPRAQGRFYYNPSDSSLVGEPEDVTDIPWRRRWDPAKASLQAYGARIGSRYENAWYPGTWAYNPGFWDEDGMVFRWDPPYGDGNLWLAYMALNPPGMPIWVGGYSDFYWTISSISSSPSFTSARPQSPDDFSVSMSNDPVPNWNPEWGATLDPATSAKSRLFRYWIEFDEKRKASAVPRKDGDRWMNVRCRIVPQNVRPNWVDHVELKVWDPAYPNAQRHRIINGDSGDPCLSKMWDGKLYVDGNESTTPYYTQASDVFMQATIHWNPLSPSKPWENSGDSNTFDEDRYAIVASDGTQPVSSSPTNFAWIGATPSMPALSATLVANGDAQPPTGTSWQMTITFPRGDSIKPAPDVDNYYGYFPQATAWGDIRAAMNGAIRGGNATLRCGLGSTFVRHDFCIRDRNPIPDSTVQQHIGQVASVHWYTYHIALHETRLWMPSSESQNPEYVVLPKEEDPAQTDGAAACNQFYPYSYRGRLPNQDPHLPEYGSDVGYPGNPCHHHDESDDLSKRTIGYGMMMITNPAATAEQIWNWQKNVDAAISVLNTKRNTEIPAVEAAILRSYSETIWMTNPSVV